MARRRSPSAHHSTIPSFHYSTGIPIVSRRRGLTLLEILLVLALVVIVFAIVVPTTTGVFSSQRLEKSAELVRSQLSRARIEAMRSGQIQAFHFQMGGTKYVTVPWYTSDDEATDAEEDTSGYGAAAGSSMLPGMVNPQNLPDGITFVVVLEVADSRTETLTQQMTTTFSLEVNDDAPWSPPILFYPDGTTSEASIHLANDRGWTVAIDLRGVTGIAQVGDLEKQIDPFRGVEESP